MKSNCLAEAMRVLISGWDLDLKLVEISPASPLFENYGAAGRISDETHSRTRTDDQRVNSPLLYLTELSSTQRVRVRRLNALSGAVNLRTCKDI